jgi:PIN domain nuclease of toxin-antitoxin system
VILLDTNALIWLDQRHKRARPLIETPQPLAISPASILEVRFLIELGRLRLKSGSIGALVEDDRWVVDDVPSVEWFEEAAEASWTHDPFDRLIVAHARHRGWRLATGDAVLVSRLRASEILAL